MAAVTACGCASSRNTELLEARLRVSEDRAWEAEQALADANREISSLRDDLVLVREQAAGRGTLTAVGPQPVELAFASLMTGGVDEDGHPGDEAVRAIIQPIGDGSGPIRAEGELVVELLDVAAPADRRVCGTWSYSGQELRELWSTGLFSTGYELELTPSARELPEGALLLARLTTPEGKQLEATHTLKLKPAISHASSLQTVSAAESDFPRDANVIHAMDDQLPDSLPVREAPPAAGTNTADPLPSDTQSRNPFAEFLPGRARTSDAWTDQTIPVMR